MNKEFNIMNQYKKGLERPQSDLQNNETSPQEALTDNFTTSQYSNKKGHISRYHYKFMLYLFYFLTFIGVAMYIIMSGAKHSILISILFSVTILMRIPVINILWLYCIFVIVAYNITNFKK